MTNDKFYPLICSRSGCIGKEMMGQDTFNFYLNFDGDVDELNVGDIIKLKDGKDYKITKKTKTALAVERWMWYNKIIEKLEKKFGKSYD